MNRWKPFLYLLNPIHISLHSLYISVPHVPGGMVICPLRRCESITCRCAPSLYDTRWHSMVVMASTESGSVDQIISLSGSISHILMCCRENRSHAVGTEPAKWPTILSTTLIQQSLWWDLADSKVLVFSFLMGHTPKWVMLLVKVYTFLRRKPCCFGC